MRNSTNDSKLKTNAVQDDNVSNSAKKLKQARLPFKVIAPSISADGSKPSAVSSSTATVNDVFNDTNSTDIRKRKLSYNITDDDDDINGENSNDDNNISKENVKVLKATKKKKTTLSNNDMKSHVVSLLDDDEKNDNEEEGKKQEVTKTSLENAVDTKDSDLNTPKAASKEKRKGAGTPQTSSAKKEKNGSASKLQIKLPLSAGKKKRRKSKLQKISTNASVAEVTQNSTQEISSDDIEDIGFELNPLKRIKLNSDDDVKEPHKTETNGANPEQKELEIIALDSDLETEDEANSKHTKTIEETKVLSAKDKLKNKSHIKKDSNTTSSYEKSSLLSENKVSNKSSEDDAVQNKEIFDSSDGVERENKKHNYCKEILDQSILSDNEADDETDNLAGKSANVSLVISKNCKSENDSNIIEPLKDDKNTNFTSKNLTPKQVKLMEQRRKTREEKERKLQDEKLKKQQEKEEKELAKKREREEKDEQRRKEREEKEEQKRKERDEKERKRLAELEAKNEEKRKRNEVKEEELRKKEEERKRKEQEKEEAELKKKKAAQAFTKFFLTKTPTNAQLKNEDDSNTGDGAKLLAFRPFQVKGDMKLAPVCRKNLTSDEKRYLDDLFNFKNNDDEEEIVRRKPLQKPQLYLSDLRSGKILPGKWRRPSTESKDDVIILEDELERVGQEIVEDTPAYIREEMRVKFYKFHDNRRPPYYGTWRKKSSVVKARKPFAQDMKFFDYEVDSDDEWEEEEPGESLEDGSDDDKEKESEDDDYEVDNEWFVPHGHLSDEEMQNEDEFGMGDDNTREAQKAKLQILQQEFAQEMKKKTEKIKPRLIGCIWADVNGNQPSECAKIIWDTLEKKAMLFTESPNIEEPEEPAEPSSPSGAAYGNVEKINVDKAKPITLSDTMIKDLTRLVHGNNRSKNFLVNEYIAFVEKTEESVKNGDLRKPLKSVVRDKIEEMAEWQAVEANSIDVTTTTTANTTDSTKKKKKAKRRLCWVVKQEMLNKMDLSSLELQNSWKYILSTKLPKTDKEVKTDEMVTSNNESITTSTTITVAEDCAKGKDAVATPQITKFTKVLTDEEKALKLQNSPASINTISNENSGTKIVLNTPTTAKEKKRVPLLMSVSRGQQISTPVKNKLISQFLQKGKGNYENSLSSASTSSSKTTTLTQVEDDDVVILD